MSDQAIAAGAAIDRVVAGGAIYGLSGTGADEPSRREDLGSVPVCVIGESDLLDAIVGRVEMILDF